MIGTIVLAGVMHLSPGNSELILAPAGKTHEERILGKIIKKAIRPKEIKFNHEVKANYLPQRRGKENSRFNNNFRPVKNTRHRQTMSF